MNKPTSDMRTATHEYIPYGPEWEKEIMKFNKKELIEMIRNAYCAKCENDRSQPIEKDEMLTMAADAYKDLLSRYKELEAQLKDGKEKILTAFDAFRPHINGHRTAMELFFDGIKALESPPIEPEAQKWTGRVKINDYTEGNVRIEEPQPEKAQEEQEIWEEIFLNYPVGDWLFSREYINEMIKKYSIQTRQAP